MNPRTSEPSNWNGHYEFSERLEAVSRLPIQVSATKSLTGHAQGAAGVQEAIYSLLMLEHGFLAASANVEEVDPEAEGMPILRTMEEGSWCSTALNLMTKAEFVLNQHHIPAPTYSHLPPGAPYT